MPVKFLLAMMAALIVHLVPGTAVYKVEGPSMEPALHAGERVRVDEEYYSSHEVERGDLVVLEIEGRTFIKRVIGLPGEWVSIRGDVVKIDGKVLEEPYLKEAIQEARSAGHTYNRMDDPEPDAAAADGEDGEGDFVLGDNRSDSLDSRIVGRIKLEDIKGKVKATGSD